MSEALARTGVRVALDWGAARIGVAACDARGTLAYPVETIAPASDLGGVRARLAAIVAEYEPIEWVLGLPRHLKGVEGAAADGVRAKAAWLTEQFALPIRLLDERLTTVLASQQLHAAGRPAKKQRTMIDQVAAVAILNQALETERNTGAPAGELYGDERRS